MCLERRNHNSSPCEREVLKYLLSDFHEIYVDVGRKKNVFSCRPRSFFSFLFFSPWNVLCLTSVGIRAAAAALPWLPFPHCTALIYPPSFTTPLSIQHWAEKSQRFIMGRQANDLLFCVDSRLDSNWYDKDFVFTGNVFKRMIIFRLFKILEKYHV